jgi:hypothetical protein
MSYNSRKQEDYVSNKIWKYVKPQNGEFYGSWQIKPGSSQSFVNKRTGMWIHKNEETNQWLGWHPSLNDSHVIKGATFEEVLGKVNELTRINVFCDWMKRSTSWTKLSTLK